ncbi:MAG: efflux RND transporter periplasmic adaptor subunit [Pseudomonadota bacterium]
MKCRLGLVLLLSCLTPLAATAQGNAPPEVDVSQPVVQQIQIWDQFTGRFEAQERVEVRARVSGYLQSVNFTDGQIVNKGDLLYVIDPRPFEAEVGRARAGVLNARSQLTLAEIELERAEELLERRTISASEVDRRMAQRDIASAEVQSAESLLRTAELDLEFSNIRSPITGRISETFVDIGNLVSGGMTQPTLLATIVSLDPIYFEFDVSEQAYLKYSRLARSGIRSSSRETANPVYVRVSGEDNWTRRGHMNYVANEIGDNTGTVRGRAVFENDDYFLQPGLFGQLRLIGSEPFDGVLVPDEAIVSDQSVKLVMVVGADNLIETRTVTLGPIVNGLRVISDGLSGDETVVVNGVQRARPGAPVTPNPVEINVTPDGLDATPVVTE